MKKEGTVYAWRIYYHSLLWNSVANHLVQHSVCKITSMWPWNPCIEGFYNWSSHTWWWEQAQRHCSLLVTGHEEDEELALLILPAQSLCQHGSQASSSSSSVKHNSLNLMKELKMNIFILVMSWARARVQWLQITKGWEFIALQQFGPCEPLSFPVSCQGLHSLPGSDLFVFQWAVPECFMLFSPLTCDSRDIYLKHTSNSSIRV